MSHALVTIIAPLALDRVGEAEAAIDALGNPARADIRTALGKHEDAEHGALRKPHAFRGRRTASVPTWHSILGRRPPR